MKRHTFRRTRVVVAVFLFLYVAFAIATGGWIGAWLLNMQAGPTWTRLAVDSSVAALIATLVLLATTFAFGRYFCAVFCPLGVMQECVGLLHPGGATRIPNARILRYAVAATTIFLLAGGWAVVFRLIGPFSRFGAGVSGVTAGVAGDWPAAVTGLAPLVGLAGLVLWKRRVFCTALCPVGAILGIAAKRGVYRLRVNDSCGRCGFCEKTCPTGCIDSKNREIDAERCVLCLKCVSVCPRQAISYSRENPTPVDEEHVANGSRRGFLLKGGATVAGLIGAGWGLGGAIRGVARAGEDVGTLVLPPGAIDAARFQRQCTGCRVCVASCPAGIIKPSPFGFGPVRLNYTRSGCRYDCALCGTVCPTNALRHIPLEDKQWLKIGVAVFDAPKCKVVKEGVACDLCARVCPKEAIFMADGLGGLRVPEVAEFHCIGCGACQAVCPLRSKAITVKAIAQQPVGS